MCHNLGANQTLDPSVPNNGLVGETYLYGKAISVQAGGSGTITPNYDQWALNAANPLKGVNDPCPAGYRVPTLAEWSGVVANNTITRIGTYGTSTAETILRYIAKIGTQLYLPVDGYINSGTTRTDINRGTYLFASNAVGSGYKMNYVYLNNTSFSTTAGGTTLNSQSFDVRCIEQ